MKWNDDWRRELEIEYPDSYNRLCDCRNKKSDIPIIAKLIYKYNPKMGKENCLERTLIWIGDWNGQYQITDLTEKEYKNFLKTIDKE